MRRNITAVEAALTQAYRDMNAADIDRLMTLYMPDALIQSPGQPPVVGTTAIREFWLATFARYHVQLSPEILEVTTLGEVVVVRGRAVGVLKSRADEASVPVDSWFMQIYRPRADGTLLFWRGANGPSVATLSSPAPRTSVVPDPRE